MIEHAQIAYQQASVSERNQLDLHAGRVVATLRTDGPPGSVPVYEVRSAPARETEDVEGDALAPPSLVFRTCAFYSEREDEASPEKIGMHRFWAFDRSNAAYL